MLTFVDKDGNQLPEDVWNLAKGPETALIATSISHCFAKKCSIRKSIKQDLRLALSQASTDIDTLDQSVLSTQSKKPQLESIHDSNLILNPYPL